MKWPSLIQKIEKVCINEEKSLLRLAPGTPLYIAKAMLPQFVSARVFRTSIVILQIWNAIQKTYEETGFAYAPL